MKLFVVNLSRQVVQFHYRLPEDRAVWPPRVLIHPGRQMQIEGELMPEAIAAIIDQHAKYGFISMREALDMKRPTAVAYALGEPASAEDMAALAAINLELVTTESGRIREESTAAMMAARLSVKGDRQPKPSALVTQVIEVGKDGEDETGFKHTISAGRDGRPSRFARDNGLAQ